LIVLALAALACQTVMGGSPSVQPTRDEPVQVPNLESATAAPAPTDSISQPEGPDTGYENENGGGDAVAATDFPLPADAESLMDIGDGSVNFQTGMSVDEAVAFYREKFTGMGLTERELLTTISDGVFSMVFDGHKSGKAVVIQGVDLGNGKLNINIRLEDV
jgi:hypothetical protein